MVDTQNDLQARNAAIPSEMKQQKQWARWKPSDERKNPCNLDGTWMEWKQKPESKLSFEEVARYPHIETFITLESGIVGIDFDGCIDKNGEIHPLVKSWLGSTYAEISPSGTGIKMWVRGKVPNNEAIINERVPWGIPGKHTGIEVYADKRPFTVTGNIIPGCPSEINEVQTILDDIVTRFTPVKKGPKKGYWTLAEWKAWVNQHQEVIEEYEDCFDIVCPWKNLHTTPGESMRIWYGPPHTVNCFHAHCKGRTWDDINPKQQWTNYSPGQDRSSNGNGHAPTGGLTKELLCSFTDDDAGNGDALEALYGQDFLYCPSRGWLYYTKTHWKLDPDGAEVKKKAVATLRARRHAAVDLEKEAIIKCTKAEDKRVNGCISRFRTLVNVSIDDFDNNPDAINCKNGVVNLQTGELTPHSREQRFTYCIPVAYRPESFSQEWTDYLTGVVGGGQEVIDYLQLALGYSMTGHTREEILFYLFGPPRSGKGTISEIFMSLMPSPLSTGVDFNSFTAKREGDVSNFDLAPLKASRLVFASESLRGQSLNPAKIKQLTGGDRVRACFKHKDFFEYRPQFKVWMLSNWPVNGDPEDDALWGRVRVITFPNSFLGNEDKTKKSGLQKPDALEAILAWGIKGAMDWYALGSKGLTTPDVIKNVTQEQRAELDYVQQWLDECCEGIEEAKDCWESNEDVINSYTAWCKNNHVQFPKGPRSLALSLQSKGYKTGIQKKIEGKNTKGVEGMYIYNKVQPKKGDGIA